MDRPFRTLNVAVKPLQPGDTLVVRGGVYSESLRNVIPPGKSWDAPVTIKAFAGEKVVLRPDSGAANVMEFSLVNDKPQQFIVLDGLVLDGINVMYDCVKVYKPAHHLRFVGCEIKNAANQGILAANEADGCEYLNLLVHDNGIVEGAHGLYLGGRSVRIEGCRIYNNGGNALRNNGIDDGVIAYNTIHHNARHQISPAVEFHGSGTVMHHNLLYADRSGMVIIARASGKIYHNTLADNVGYGIYLSCGPTETVHVANNVIAGSKYIGLFNAGCAPDSVIENNLSFGHPYNFENRAEARTWRGNVEADPRFVDTARRDYRLLAASPARDTAVPLEGLPRDLNGRLYKVGPAPDHGALEFDAKDDTPRRNRPPEVDAGPDVFTTMANPTVALAATVADEARSDKPVTVSWRTRIGPAPVVFDNPQAPRTSARFSTPGAYLLQVIADDGELSAGDLVAAFVHPQLPASGPIRIEAEHMLLELYGARDGAFASGGKYVQPASPTTTSLYLRLPLPKGTYDVVVGYFDENDGQASQQFDLLRGDMFRLGGPQVVLHKEWRMDQDLPAAEPSPQTAARRQIDTSVLLEPGDALRITTLRDKAESGAVDYIEFIPKN
jgi:hypothetical protein